MPKVSIKANLEEKDTNLSHKIKISGIINNNELIYHDGDILVTLIESDNKIEMKRVHLDYEIKLIFIDKTLTKGYYKMLKTNTYFELDILTNRLYIDENKIIIDYQLAIETTSIKQFLFSLEYMIIK